MSRNRDWIGNENKKLPVQLTPAEIAAKEHEHTQKSLELARLLVKHKAIKDELKDAENAIKLEIKGLLKTIDLGTEIRPVRLSMYADYGENRVITYRSDTKEEIDSRPMTDQERQGDLFKTGRTSGAGVDVALGGARDAVIDAAGEGSTVTQTGPEGRTTTLKNSETPPDDGRPYIEIANQWVATDDSREGLALVEVNVLAYLERVADDESTARAVDDVASEVEISEADATNVLELLEGKGLVVDTNDAEGKGWQLTADALVVLENYRPTEEEEGMTLPSAMGRLERWIATELNANDEGDAEVINAWVKLSDEDKADTARQVMAGVSIREALAQAGVFGELEEGGEDETEDGKYADVPFVEYENAGEARRDLLAWLKDQDANTNALWDNAGADRQAIAVSNMVMKGIPADLAFREFHDDLATIDPPADVDIDELRQALKDATQTKAGQKGAKAFNYGQPIDHNTYTAAKQRGQWDTAWRAAQALSQAEA